VSDDLLHALAATRPEDSGLDGAVVVGYAAVVEWMSPDGEKWLTLETGNAMGEPLVRWQLQGYLHNVLHDPAWQGGCDDGDD
jgi:hypothetical protein